ncbi:MAG: flagellin [Selenomonadaceae bacterium]|nr:flagellin [Selenomonadaceae bacterium]
MSMKVRNNLAANSALNTLNQNNSNLSKSLKKVSTGMDFNSSGDNASGYSISEKMRVQIRSLNQNIRNVQTGNSLVAVAEGGIQSIINNLRSMKEMCLNAMNDHNTDSDRATLQKEYDKRMDLIQDIASETSYNGKILLDGRYESPDAMKYTDPVQLPMDKDSNGSLTVPLYNGMTTTQLPIEDVWVYRPSNRANWAAASAASTAASGPATTASGLVQNTSVRNLASNFSAMTGTSSGGQMFRGGPINATAQQSYSGGTKVKIDFSGAVRTTDGSTPTVGDFNQQGFSILCGACYQFLNFRFDASLANSASTYDNNPSTTNPQAKAYTIGIADVANVSDLAKALYDGIKSAQANNTGGSHYYTYTSGTLVSVDTSHNVGIDTDGNGTYYFTKDSSPALGIYDASNDPTNTPTPTPPAPPSEPYKKEGLIIHDCPKAGQHMKLYMNDMRLDAMKLTGTGTKTQEYAALSLGYVDHAINYALNEATRMGAYRSRLEMSEANLVTGSENTQGAESVLRDADMAKAMTEYTKNNVLLQSSQSMLAQANQNSRDALGLLQ